MAPMFSKATISFLIFAPLLLLPDVTTFVRCSGESVNVREQKVEVDSATGFKAPIPLPVFASCNAGDTYDVTSIDYFFENPSALECIFAAGETPSAIPLGFAYGKIIAIENTGAYSPLVQIVYQGDYVVKTMCQEEERYFGWLRIAGLEVGTAEWTIGQLDWDVAPGEYPLGDKESIIMDFTAKFDKICPIEGNESAAGLKKFIPFQRSPFPMSHFKDLGRVVGVDSDGGIILLNKAYIYTEKQGAHTVLFYAIKTFDPSVQPPTMPIEVPVGPNNEDTIVAHRQGPEGVVKRVVELLSDPVKLKAEVLRSREETAGAVEEVVTKKESTVQNTIASSLKNVFSPFSLRGQDLKIDLPTFTDIFANKPVVE